MKNDILLKSLFDNQIAFTYPMFNEVAIAKKIDIKHLSFIKNIIKQNRLQLRIRYRGPSTSSYTRDPSYMHMNYATNFALYLR